MLGVVGSSLKMVKFEPTCSYTLQQGGQTHATCCTQQCCDMLRSFGRGFTFCTSTRPCAGANYANIVRSRDAQYKTKESPYAVFRLERATEVLELTYLGKYFACVNAN